MSAAGRRDAAWGWRWRGLDDTGRVLNAAPGGWPEVEVTVTYDALLTPTPTPVVWSPDRAEFGLRSGGRIAIGGQPPSVALCLPRPVPAECVVQPHLAAAAASLGIWAGSEALHGGAFVHDGRAWALIGDKGAGKSTALGQLAGAGCHVLADDLVIWRRGEVLAGPRCVDLRPEAARELGVGRPLGVIGSRERWRLDLAEGPTVVAFGGLIRLQWGEELSLQPLDVQERLQLILLSGALPIPSRPSEAVLELASHTALSWTRPKSWARSDDATRVLLDGLTGA